MMQTPGSAPISATATPEPPSGSGMQERLEMHLSALAALAQEMGSDPEALLTLLRRLEQLHRSIQDGPFRNSLPEDRNQLFRLLEEMESSGGWPYIPRLQLRTFMDLLQRDRSGSAAEGSQTSLAA